jgi:hypothetical protein
MAKTIRILKKQTRKLVVLTPLYVDKWAEFSSKMLCAPTYPGVCKNDHRVTQLILSEIPGIDVEKTIFSFMMNGARCDCGVVMNAMRHLENEYYGTCTDCYFKNLNGEELDPDCPKCIQET